MVLQEETVEKLLF